MYLYMAPVQWIYVSVYVLCLNSTIKLHIVFILYMCNRPLFYPSPQATMPFVSFHPFTSWKYYDRIYNFTAVVTCVKRSLCYDWWFAGYPHTFTQSGTSVTASPPHAEAGPILPVQCRGPYTTHGHVHRARSLARLHLVLHRQTGAGR